MDDATRRAVEERAYLLWEQAGRPEGSALAFWLQAELDFGVIPTVAADDPFVTLQELANEAREQEGSEPVSLEGLQRSVDAAVPPMEILVESAAENTVSQRVESAAKGNVRQTSVATLDGGDRVP
jgi:hypothetical protein